MPETWHASAHYRQVDNDLCQASVTLETMCSCTSTVDQLGTDERVSIAIYTEVLSSHQLD